jgi:hypothetical protein
VQMAAKGQALTTAATFKYHQLLHQSAWQLAAPMARPSHRCLLAAAGPAAPHEGAEDRAAKVAATLACFTSATAAALLEQPTRVLQGHELHVLLHGCLLLHVAQLFPGMPASRMHQCTWQKWFRRGCQSDVAPPQQPFRYPLR